MHIAFFYQYYHTPDCAATGRHFTLLQHWASRHEVTLITSDAWRRQQLTDLYDWVPPNVHLLEYEIPYDNSMGLLERGLAFSRFVVQSAWGGARMQRPDVIFATSTPLSVAWAAAQVARWHKVPWVFEIRDLWPDFPIEMGAIRSAWLRRRLRTMERKLYASAAHLIPLSPDMEAHVRAFGVPAERITMTYNGTDVELIDTPVPPSDATVQHLNRLSDAFVCVYAGTFGRANAIPTLIDVARRLAQHPEVHMLFLGDGFYRPDLQALSEQQDNVSVLPPQPRHQIFHFLRRANLSLVPFINRPVLRTNSPAKFYDSLAVGTPVVVTNPGWTRAFVAEHQCGWYTEPEDAPALYQLISQLSRDPAMVERAGQKGASIARTAFDRRIMAHELLETLESFARH